jgi:hypothetical protein
MVDDLVSVATADKNKPELGYLVAIVVGLMEQRSDNESLMVSCVSLLSQLLFEGALIEHFIDNKQRMETVLESLEFSSHDAARDLNLLRRRLSDLPDAKASAEDELDNDFTPKEPTFVFVYCAESGAPIATAIVTRLHSEGFVASLRLRPLDWDFVKESYGGVILLSDVSFADFEE